MGIARWCVVVVAIAACSGPDPESVNESPPGSGDDSGSEEDTAGAVDMDADGYAPPNDCDDANPDIHPGAAETCDGVDEDCDGAVDDDPSEGPIWYADHDGDAYGDDLDFVVECDEPDGRVATAGDCDDADAAMFPGAEEICADGRDNDCVPGGVDECRTFGVLDGADVFQFIEHDWAHTTHLYFPDIAAAGDVNGDGAPDVLIGLPDYGGSEVHPGSGAAALCVGPLTGIDSMSDCALMVRDPSEYAAEAGRSVSGISDLDSDGYDEVYVADPSPQDVDFDSTTHLCAYSYAFYGPITGIRELDDADLKFGTCDDYSFGTDAAPGPRVDGDPTIVVGSPGYTRLATYEWSVGAVYIIDPIAGAEADPTFGFGAMTRVEGELTEDYLGDVVGDLGDIDGDGTSDFAAATNPQGNERFGITYVIAGAPTGVVSATDSRAIFDHGDSFGPAHDENGDGYDDILVASFTDGVVRLFLSPFPDAVDVTVSGAETASFAVPLNVMFDAYDPTGVDFDGDELSDMAFVNYRFPSEGDEALYLQYAPAEGAISLRDMDLVVTMPDAWPVREAPLENVGDLDLDGHEDLITAGFDFDLFLLRGMGM